MRYGVTFKGINSKSLGLTRRTAGRTVLPGSLRSSLLVPYRAGSVDFNLDTYQDAEISETFSWLCLTPEQATAKAELISGWLHNDGFYHELIFEDYPNRKYYAKVVNAVTMQIDPCKGSVNVTFLINPPYPFALDNSPVSPKDVQDRLLWDTAILSGNQYLQSFAADGYMRITLAGTGASKPVIKLLNYIPSGLQLSYGTQQWQYIANLYYDGIIMDCEAETVKKASDGSNLFSNVNPLKSDYFELAPGQIQIDISGVAGVYPKNTIVAITLNPNYGG